jgi:hypothetical protein
MTRTVTAFIRAKPRAGREGFEPSNARSKAWCLASLATAQHVNRATHRPVSCRTPRSTSANGERRNQGTVSLAANVAGPCGPGFTRSSGGKSSRATPSQEFMNGMLLGRALACQRDAAVFAQFGFRPGSGERYVILWRRRIGGSLRAASRSQLRPPGANIASIAVPIHEQVSARIATEFMTDCHLPYIQMSRIRSVKHAN